jgi:hypothetical protein
MAQNVAVVCYINGVRFDPGAVSVSATDGGLINFSVEVPAVAEWDLLPPRSHAAIFYADPVTNVWRFLVEGEYTGYSKHKSASGSRHRTLMFRGLHAMWDTVKIVSMLGSTNPGVLNSVLANGQNVNCGLNSNLASASLDAFIMKAVGDGTTNLSVTLMKLANAFVEQSAVDSFYHFARHLDKKMFTLEDAEIQKLISTKMFTHIVKNSITNADASESLADVFSMIENIALYHRVPVLNPPKITTQLSDVSANQFDRSGSMTMDGTFIPEMFFLPNLLNAVPPACNVIFRSQITDIDVTRSFLSEPTRVVGQVTSALADTKLPAFVVATSTEFSEYVAGQTFDSHNASMKTADNGASTVVSHGFISPEELYKGVIPRTISNICIEDTLAKVESSKPGVTAKDSGFAGIPANSIPTYMMACMRYHFDLARSAARSVQVNCAFLPYIAVGFPCLVEDSTGPFWGTVTSVTHNLGAGMPPSTTMLISNMREAYYIPDRMRHAPMPRWVNSAFWPNNINKTYAQLLGTNLPLVAFPGAAGGGQSPHAAMVPQDLIKTTGTPDAEFASKQVNLDELAQSVLRMPSYDASGLYAQTLDGAVTLADMMFAQTGDYQKAMLRYQFRPGVTLKEFADFHSLDGVQGLNASVDRNTDQDSTFANALPDNLVKNTSVGHELFGAPSKLEFVGNKDRASMLVSSDKAEREKYAPTQADYEADYQMRKFLATKGSPSNTYGAYVAVSPGGNAGTISTFRQNVAQQIAARIKGLITDG